MNKAGSWIFPYGWTPPPQKPKSDTKVQCWMCGKDLMVTAEEAEGYQHHAPGYRTLIVCDDCTDPKPPVTYKP